MLNLLAKDFKLIFAKKEDIKKQIISSVFMVIVFAALIAIETFIFKLVLDKIKDYYQAPISFLTLFLFIVSVLMMIFAIIQARKLFFNKLDMEQLNVHPVSNGQIIASKLIFLFMLQYVTSLMFTYPLFISYAITFYKLHDFYFLALFYPLLSAVFEIGVALIFVYPVKLIGDWLKKHLIIQFVFAMVIIFVLAFMYSQVLNVFINLVANNSINTIFSTEFIDNLAKIKQFFIPTYYLADIFIFENMGIIIPYLLIAIGVFLLGLTISVSSFKYFKNSVHANEKINKEKEIKITTMNKALIKKEIILLFKDSGYILSFTGLLVVQPFLAYLVINALNTIFQSGAFAYYITLLPNFVPLIDILLIMMFTLIINQGANNYISMENKNVRLMKTIPVNLYKQLLFKVMIPFILSSASLLITILVLAIGQVISITTAIFGFILSIILLAIFEIVSLFEELKVKRNRPRSSTISSLYSYLLPLIYFAVALLLSYNNVHVILVYVIALAAIALTSLPYVIKIKERIARLFLELEMVN